MFRVEATDQVYNQTNEIVCLGGNVNQNADGSTGRRRPAHTQRIVQLLEVYL